ncbi:MAG: phospholipase D-like domain-containing protein [Sulfolobales archaeon]
MNARALALACLLLVIGALIGYSISASKPPVYHTVTATLLSTTTKTLELFITLIQTLPTTITGTAERTATWVSTVTITRAVTTISTTTFTTTYVVTKPVTVTVAVGVDLLVDKDYYYALLSFLSRANRSIYIIMYAVKYDPSEPDDPVNILLYTVVNAYKRGLDVKVLVDDVTFSSYSETIDYLKSSRVPIRLDKSKSITTHAKLVIVDDRYVFVGSHNWTESALIHNHEVSVLIVSDTVAQQVEEYFNMLWSEGRAI